MLDDETMEVTEQHYFFMVHEYARANNNAKFFGETLENIVQLKGLGFLIRYGITVKDGALTYRITPKRVGYV